MKTSPGRLRLALILSIALTIAAAIVSADGFYRARFRCELASLESSNEALHTFRSRAVEIGRFGFYGPAVEPSLYEDLLEWIKLRLGRPSKLDGGDKPKPWLVGYYAVHFTMQHLDDSWPPSACHVLIWSPRKLRFVHFLTEGACPEFPSGSCPWRSNPKPAIANR